MSRYLLQQSTDNPLWWTLTDTETKVVCRFKEGGFNETQMFTPLYDDQDYDMSALPAIVNGMTAWLAENHYELVFMSPQAAITRTRKTIGEQIRDAREVNGYSLRHLAKLTGISHNHIARIEQGKYNVTIDTLAVIAEALDMDICIGYYDEQ